MAVIYREYGVIKKIPFVLLDPSGDLIDTATIVAGDFRINLNYGGWGNVGGTITNEGEGWYSYTPILAETQVESLILKGYDQTTPQEWIHQNVYVEFGGHANAMWKG